MALVGRARAGRRSRPTAPEPLPLVRIRRWRSARRVFTFVLVAFLAAGLFGLLGVRSSTVSDAAGPYELTLTYASVTRPGLTSPWEVELTREGGFDGPVTIATTVSYLERFRISRVLPEPARATTTGDLLIWEFDAPPGDTLSVSLDASLDPSTQAGATATTAVLVDGRPIVSVRYHTMVMP